MFCNWHSTFWPSFSSCPFSRNYIALKKMSTTTTTTISPIISPIIIIIRARNCHLFHKRRKCGSNGGIFWIEGRWKSRIFEIAINSARVFDLVGLNLFFILFYPSCLNPISLRHSWKCPSLIFDSLSIVSSIRSSSYKMNRLCCHRP